MEWLAAQGDSSGPIKRQATDPGRPRAVVARAEQQAADLIHDLVAKPPSGASGRDLLRFAGTLDDESARQMSEAIEEGCERVDLGEW